MLTFSSSIPIHKHVDAGKLFATGYHKPSIRNFHEHSDDCSCCFRKTVLHGFWIFDIQWNVTNIDVAFTCQSQIIFSFPYFPRNELYFTSTFCTNRLRMLYIKMHPEELLMFVIDVHINPLTKCKTIKFQNGTNEHPFQLALILKATQN